MRAEAKTLSRRTRLYIWLDLDEALLEAFVQAMQKIHFEGISNFVEWLIKIALQMQHCWRHVRQLRGGWDIPL